MSKNKKKSSRKLHNQTIDEDLEYYEDSKMNKSYYENFEYLSNKEKLIFENKFSKPKNKSQERYFKELNKKGNKIIVATGPAGTGKTLLATEIGIKNFLLGKYDKIIFTRPSVSVDEDLGYLPGSLEEKMAPWMRPIYDILYNFITPKEVTNLIEMKLIEISPLGYMRGRTFKNCWIIADEMQNCSCNQMIMLLTRIGENTKLVITGDLDQVDRLTELNGLEDFLNKFKGKRSDSITNVEFNRTDIEREEVVKEVLQIYSGDIIPPLYKMEDIDDTVLDSPVEKKDGTQSYYI
jgi:phosphate starvation-inducible PhoH-like protein